MLPSISLAWRIRDSGDCGSQRSTTNPNLQGGHKAHKKAFPNHRPFQQLLLPHQPPLPAKTFFPQRPSGIRAKSTASSRSRWIGFRQKERSRFLADFFRGQHVVCGWEESTDDWMLAWDSPKRSFLFVNAVRERRALAGKEKETWKNGNNKICFEDWNGLNPKQYPFFLSLHRGSRPPC